MVQALELAGDVKGADALRAKYEGPDAPVRILRKRLRTYAPLGGRRKHYDDVSLLSLQVTHDPPTITVIEDITPGDWLDVRRSGTGEISSMACHNVELPESKMVELLGITEGDQYIESVKESVLERYQRAPSADANSASPSEPASAAA